jgi:hypothetical protein
MSKSKKLKYWLFDSDSEEDDAEELPMPAPVVAVVAVAPPAPPPTPPPKAAGGKRKRDGLPTGIRMIGKQFVIVTRDVVTKKLTSRYFKTLKKAVAAKAAECAKQAEHERQRAARPQAEKRAENMARHGKDSEREREFASELHAADPKIETMNDFVLADSCGFFYDDNPKLALGIQLKVAPKPRECQKNMWEFAKVNLYPGIPVVCWRADTQDGWIYDGNTLVERKARSLPVTPGGINAKLAINTDNKRTRATPLPIDGLVARLRKLAADRERFPPRTKAFLSWQFDGKAHAHLKERIGLHLEELRDPKATFPEAQAGSYDQLGGDGVTRRQLKTGCVLAGCKSWHVNLRENAGHVYGKATWRPYPAGAFDELVVYAYDWPTNTARRWRIPESKLAEKGYLRTATDNGKKNLYVSEFAEPQLKYRKDGSKWTTAYFEGTVPLDLPPEAEAAAGHLLDDLRSGRVA